MEKIVGVVAEYNPFHRGHRYQIQEIRAHCKDAGIVVALSSSFLQRGVPALLDKWIRAEMAVLCGADLVLELPVPFCCNNAGVFAGGAVKLLKATGVVGALSFGMEDRTDLLGTIPAILVQEPPAFKTILQEFLEKGHSYAEARAQAAEACCPGAAELLGKPNNTLAFAYAEAALREKAGLEMLPLQRVGAGYHDRSSSPVMSAAGIREALASGREDAAFAAMPEASARLLRGAMERGRCRLDDKPLWTALRLLLTRCDAQELARYAEISEGIENRFLSQYGSCESFGELAAKVATRRYPLTRVQRQLTYLLLHITKEDNRTFQARGPAYIRPLAMNERGREMLRLMRKRSALPVVTKPSALKGNFYAQKIMDLEFRAAAIWESFLPCPDWRHEVLAAPALVEGELE